MEHLVSIITPCKNAESWLIDCHQSIASQSYIHWEWIIVDDHSSDRSAQLIHQLAAEDQRVQLYHNSGQGIIEALKTAIGHCSGDFITRMDTDDLMPPNRLIWMVNELSLSIPRTVITGLVQYFSSKPVSKGYQQYETWINSINLSGQQWPNIYRECVIASPNWMMRAHELQSIIDIGHLTYPEDYDLVFEWYKHGFNIKVIPEITLLWREHPKRTSRNSENYQQEAFFKLKIRRFIELDYNGAPLFIWGNNVKSQLTRNILIENNIRSTSLDLHNYQLIEQHPGPQLLVAVYPSLQEQTQISQYLSEIQLQEGIDWWWL